MSQLENCCCCVSLRTGSFIIGCLSSVTSTLGIVYECIRAQVIRGDPTIQSKFDLQVTASASIIILYAILLTMSILLIIGIYKERSSFVKSYLIYSSIFIVLGWVMTIVRLTLPNGAAYMSYIIEILLVSTMLSVYCLLVILSYWVSLRENVKSDTAHLITNV